MTRFVFLVALGLLLGGLVPGVVAARDRSVGVGSFDRVRIEGPFDVTLATGGSPRAMIGGDPRAAEMVEVRTDGTTLAVRMRTDGRGERAAAAPTAPLRIALSTNALKSVAVIGGARVTVGRIKAARIDLSVSGTGQMEVAAAEGPQLAATVIGSGGIAIRGGYVNTARLSTNGPGRIDADAMEAGDLFVRLDGLGETKAKARYTAEVSNSGLGQVTIGGAPKCRVRSAGGGPVRCGVQR